MIKVKNITLGNSKPLYWDSDKQGDGACNVKFDFEYSGEKKANTLTFFYVPLDINKNELKCTKTKNKTMGLQVNGPFTNGDFRRDVCYGTIPWYNKNINEVRLEKVVVDYADGKRETIPGNKCVGITTEEKKISKKGLGLFVTTLAVVIAFLLYFIFKK